jgi:ATP-dependent DNA helicase PIF1
MTTEQYEIFEMIRNSNTYHFFIVGGAGSGKSYLLRQIQQLFRYQERPFITLAPTGVAAANIGGATIHSALRIKSSDVNNDELEYQSLLTEDATQLTIMKEVHTIIIDEISMVNANADANEAGT